MTTRRRSTRLSVEGNTKSLDSLTTTPRRSENLRRRHFRQAIIDSDEENIEAYQQLNGIPDIMPKGSHCTEVLKTPRRSKGASKKREQNEESTQTITDVIAEEDVQQVSPPKQKRLETKNHAKNMISPTRLLLGRLSIDARSEEESANEDGTSCEKSKEVSSSYKQAERNKYQNARRVLNSAETNRLPGREQQLQELRNFFDTHLSEQKAGSLYVSGQPGTGKTACLRLLTKSPDYAKRLKSVYINCTSIASVSGVFKKLCDEMNLHPHGKTQRDYLNAIEKFVTHTKTMQLIVLDEIDQLCSSRHTVLYTMFEWPALPNAKILLIGIANSLDLTDRALTRLNAHCYLKPQTMHFPPYNKQEIVRIFQSRLEEADVLDIFPPVTLQLLAAKVSAVSGDVRRALDIGRRVVEIAEQQKNAGKKTLNIKDFNALEEGSIKATEEKKETKVQPIEEESLKPVQVTQVAAVLNTVYGVSQNLQEDIEESFPLQQKIMICSLMLMLRKEHNKDINMGRLHEVYRKVCTKRHIPSLDQAEFAGLVGLVETRGILRIMRKKEPRLNKIQLQWDEEEVNAALADKKLISSILDDISCLAK